MSIPQGSPFPPQAFHQAAAWHHGKSEGTPQGGASGISDKVGGMVDQGIDAVGNFFDKSRWRQMAFAWVVMPAITTLACYFILGSGFFTHGLSALQNPGMTTVMGLPIVAVLAGMTVHSIVSITGDKAPEKLKNLVARVVRLAAFPIYLAAFSWLSCHVINMQHGFSSTQMSHPALRYHGDIQMPHITGIGGLCSTSWMGILIIAAVPMYKCMNMFIDELKALVDDCRLSRSRHFGRTHKERLKKLYEEQQAHSEWNEKIRELQQEREEANRRARVGPPMNLQGPGNPFDAIDDDSL